MAQTEDEFLNGPHITTASGRLVDPFDPDPCQFHITDIAHALARMPRFGGHLQRAWTVAQHSLAVCDLVPEEHKLGALLHDSSEAYLMDIPKPIKKRLPEYERVETVLMHALAKRFGFAFPLHKEVKEADQYMLFVERQQYLLSLPNSSTWAAVSQYDGRSFDLIRKEFLSRYRSLTGDRGLWPKT